MDKNKKVLWGYEVSYLVSMTDRPIVVECGYNLVSEEAAEHYSAEHGKTIHPTEEHRYHYKIIQHYEGAYIPYTE